MATLKDIWTWPNNPTTGYAQPSHWSGDASYGLDQRLADLLAGNYKPWLGLDPVADLGQTVDSVSELFAKHKNYIDSNSGENLSFYKLHRYPVVVATKKLIDSETVLSVSQSNSNPIEITFTNTHDFISGNQVRPTGFTGTLSWLNNKDFYVDVVDTSTVKLALDPGLGTLVRFYDLADSKGTLSSDVGTDSIVKIISTASETSALADSTLVSLSGFDGTLSDYNGAQYYIDRLNPSNFKLYTDAALTEPFLWQELLINEPVTQINNNVTDGDPIQITLAETVDLRDGVNLDFSATAGQIQNILQAHNSYHLKTLGSRVYELYTDATLTTPVTNEQIISWDTGDTIQPTATASSNSPEDFGITLTMPSVDFTPAVGDYISSVQSSTVGFNNVYNNTSWEITNSVPLARTCRSDGTFNDKFWTKTEKLLNVMPTTDQYAWPVYDDSGTVDITQYPGWFTLADYSSRMASNEVIDSGWTDYRTSGIDLLAENSILRDTGYTLSGSPLLKYVSVSGQDRPIYSLSAPNPDLTGYIQGSDDKGYSGTWITNKLVHIVITENAQEHEVFDYLWALRNTDPNELAAGRYNLLPAGQQPFLYKTTTGWKIMFPTGWGSVSGTTGSTPAVWCHQFDWLETSETIGLPTTSAQWVGDTWLQTPIIEDRTVGSPLTIPVDSVNNYVFTIWNTDYDVEGSDLQSGDLIAQPQYGTGDLVAFKSNFRAPTTEHPYGGWNWTAYQVVSGTGQIRYGALGSIPYPVATGTITTTYTSAFTVTVPDRGLLTEERQFIRTKQLQCFLQRTTNPGLGVADIGNPFQDSTTGKMTEVYAGVPGDVISLDFTNTTGGFVALSPTAPFPYEIASVSIRMPGTISYSNKDAENNTVYQARVSPTKYWKTGATSATFYSTTRETAASFNVTVDGAGKLQSVTLNTGDGPEGLYATGEDIVLPIQTYENQYIAPVPYSEDIWDTDDEWTSAGYSESKRWPTHRVPSGAKLVTSQPSSSIRSQNGTKYVRDAGFVRYQVELTYPPMTYEDFRIFERTVEAARGQTTPFYLQVRGLGPNNNQTILFNRAADSSITTTPRLKEPVATGDKLITLEGFAANQSNVFVQGEHFLTSGGNGSIHTVINNVDSNVFGEAKIRVAYPHDARAVGEYVYRNPYQVVVTLADSDLEYTVGTDGLYRFAVKFDLDEWK